VRVISSAYIEYSPAAASITTKSPVFDRPGVVRNNAAQFPLRGPSPQWASRAGRSQPALSLAHSFRSAAISRSFIPGFMARIAARWLAIEASAGLFHQRQLASVP